MKRKQVISILVAIVVVLLLQACASGTRLMTSPANTGEVTGTYTLLLYGCHYQGDIKNLAILVRDPAGYAVEIYDLPTSYKTEKGLSGDEALRRADAFVRCSIHRLMGTQIRRIRDTAGQTLGFDVRARYYPFEFGIEDVLIVNYMLKDKTARAYIRIDPDVERALESSGSDNSHEGGR